MATVEDDLHVGPERRSAAFLQLLAGMCHQFPEGRDWLFEDFVRHKLTREKFEAVISEGKLDGPASASGFLQVAGEANGWEIERKALGAHSSSMLRRQFGGRSRTELERLVYRYRARALDHDSVVLACEWRRAGTSAINSPNLIRRGLAVLDRAVRFCDFRGLSRLCAAIEYEQSRMGQSLRDTVGYTDWWKRQILKYLLKHPRRSYTTRELGLHLLSCGLKVSALDLRRFCARHGIRRNFIPGRPTLRREGTGALNEIKLVGRER